jgi:hypothetical protein
MIDSGGLPVTFVRDPDVTSAITATFSSGTNAIGAVELKSAGTEVRLPFGTAAEPRGAASVVVPVQPVDDEGNVLRQSTLEAIALSVSAGTLYETTLFNAATGPGASPAALVAGRLYHTVQHLINGTVSVQTRSSMDGVNWHVEAVDRESVVHVLVGPSKYISAAYVAGNGVLTTYLGSVR